MHLLLKKFESIDYKIGTFKVKNCGFSWKPQYSLNLSGRYLRKYAKEIGFMHPIKQQKLEKIINSYQKVRSNVYGETRNKILNYLKNNTADTHELKRISGLKSIMWCLWELKNAKKIRIVPSIIRKPREPATWELC